MSLMSSFRKRLNIVREERRKTRSSGNTLIVTIMLSPVIFGAFGTALDLSIGTYTNATLQSALDTATQSTLAQARNPGGTSGTNVTPYLSQDEARILVARNYDRNRTAPGNQNENPTLRCQTSPTGGILRAGPTGCAWTEQSFAFSISRNTLSVDVQVYEVSRPLFLQMLGIEQIEYTINSNARTTFTAG